MASILKEDANALSQKLFGFPEADIKAMINSELTKLNINNIIDPITIYNDITLKKQIMDAKTGIQKNISEVADTQPVNPVQPTGLNPEYNTTTPPAKSEIDIFPDQDKLAKGLENQGLTGDTNYTNIEYGQTAVDQGVTGNQNAGAFKPELPSFMNKIGAAEFLIFSMDEISEGGENLSNKPFSMLSDPFTRSSMQDQWLKDGKKTGKIYLCKAVPVGEINYDFLNGTSSFAERKIELPEDSKNKFQENPYKSKLSVEITPESKTLDAKDLETYIKSSIDLEKVINDMVKNILQNYFSTNQTKELNNTSNPVKLAETSPTAEYGFGADPSQICKPMEESAQIQFNLKISDVINTCKKVELPVTLQECIRSNNTSLINKRNSEVEEWIFEGVNYYLPVDKISIRKGYIKNEKTTI